MSEDVNNNNMHMAWLNMLFECLTLYSLLVLLLCQHASGHWSVSALTGRGLFLARLPLVSGNSSRSTSASGI